MESFSNKRRALGRGLDSLLPPQQVPTKDAPALSSLPSSEDNQLRGSRTWLVPIEDVQPNPHQPRKHFAESGLLELSQSIRHIGMLEPIVVRPIPASTGTAGKRYEIIAGERRWRAAQRAGLHQVPIIVREFTDEQTLEVGLIENLQREDLNPVECARAYEMLIRQYGYTQEKLAEHIGKSRVSVTNALRLLKLPTFVLDRLQSGELSEGHGRALLGAQDGASAERIAKQALASGWSVREVEARVRKSIHQASTKPVAAAPSANVKDLQDKLSQALGHRVKVMDNKGKGHIEVHFGSYDELDQLIARLTST